MNAWTHLVAVLTNAGYKRRANLHENLLSVLNLRTHSAIDQILLVSLQTRAEHVDSGVSVGYGTIYEVTVTQYRHLESASAHVGSPPPRRSLSQDALS